MKKNDVICFAIVMIAATVIACSAMAQTHTTPDGTVLDEAETRAFENQIGGKLKQESREFAVVLNLIDNVYTNLDLTDQQKNRLDIARQILIVCDRKSWTLNATQSRPTGVSTRMATLTGRLEQAEARVVRTQAKVDALEAQDPAPTQEQINFAATALTFATTARDSAHIVLDAFVASQSE